MFGISQYGLVPPQDAAGRRSLEPVVLGGGLVYATIAIVGRMTW
jgi:hypothetical protein